MLGEIRGEVRFKEPLSFHTSLRIGGPADIFVVPQDVEDVRLALGFAERDRLPVEASSSRSKAAWAAPSSTARRPWRVRAWGCQP
jgi:hypothetical protein